MSDFTKQLEKLNDEYQTRLMSLINEFYTKRDVPETGTDFVSRLGDLTYTVDNNGTVRLCDEPAIPTDPVFPDERTAKTFSKITQPIVHILHYKYLYDREFCPDWSGYKTYWYVCYNTNDNCWARESSNLRKIPGVVYFSSEEIAKACVKWLNKEAIIW